MQAAGPRQRRDRSGLQPEQQWVVVLNIPTVEINMEVRGLEPRAPGMSFPDTRNRYSAILRFPGTRPMAACLPSHSEQEDAMTTTERTALAQVVTDDWVLD
jgi:hypothetical protein